MCLPVVLLASFFRLHFTVWFEMQQRIIFKNWICFWMDTAVPKFEEDT